VRTWFLGALVIVSVLLQTRIAAADAYGDLQTAQKTWAALKSWHGEEHLSNGTIVTVDFVAPDRYRITLPQMTEVLIGGNLYMVRDGKTVPMPPMMGGRVQGMLQSYRVAPLQNVIKSSIKDLGMETIDNQPTHAYSFNSTDGDSVKLNLGSDHLPVQSISNTPKGTVTITYSGYNSPISIDAP
jgi:hypothetical protein